MRAIFEEADEMASGYPGDAVRQINRLFRDGTAAGMTDGQLLERFSTRRAEAAEAAFEALVARHGPMVLRVARGVLRDPHDVEDAFQATFLVLVRKANTLGERDILAPWLYGVARRVALKARGVAARRNRREGGVVDDPPADVAEGPWLDLRPMLHEELDRLPEKYRKPVVLCHLQGLTHAEAAQELAWPVGTVSVRLSRARKLLKERLSRRGLTVTASLWPAGLTLDGPSAALPEALIRSTAQAALAASTGKILAAGTISGGASALAQGTLTMMHATQLKWLIVPLTLVLGAAGGVVANRQVMLRSERVRAEVARAEAEFQQAEAKLAEPARRVPTPGRSPFDPEATPVQPANGTAPFGMEEGPPPKAIPPVVARGGGFAIDPPQGYFDVPAPDGPEGSKPPTIKPGHILAIEVLEALPGRPITGERVVRPDGTISLGFYGDLKVAGLDRNQVKVKLIEHLRKWINDETLGLFNIEMNTNSAKAVPPLDSNRVFVDESANFYPAGEQKAGPRVRGQGFDYRDLIKAGQLDVIEGKIHRAVKEMGEMKATLGMAGAADPNEPGISDAEKRKRVEAGETRKGVLGRIKSLEDELYQSLKELEQMRAEVKPAEAPPATAPDPPR